MRIILSHRNSWHSRRGTILIIVIWIALGLVSLALYFGHSVGMEYRAAENRLAGMQAEQAIAGARRYVQFILANPTTPGVAPSVEDDEYAVEAVPVDESMFWLIGRDPNSDTDLSEPVFGLVDEASKLNLNVATPEMLEMLPGMTTDLAAAIVDWRDADQELTPEGAESADYLALDSPYNAKDSEFETPEELRLVMGVDLDVLRGEDMNGNGVLDPNEDDGDESWPADNRDGRLDAGLLEYVTTFTREPNTREDGQQRINLRGRSARQDLSQLLTEQLGPERANQVLTQVSPTLSSTQSPLEFYMNSGMTPDEFGRVENALTVTDGDYRVGLVNVCTAPAAVLACLPGMDETLANQLVAARRDLDDSSLESVAWVSGVLDPAIATEIGPFITARSYQFSADVVAFGRNKRGMRREWMVLDVEDEVRVIYRRDRTRDGWPLGDLSAVAVSTENRM